MVYSADGIPGADALAAQKRLAALLSYKLKRDFVHCLIPIFGIRQCRAQVGSRVEVDNSNVKHRGGPPLPEAVDAYICP